MISTTWDWLDNTAGAVVVMASGTQLQNTDRFIQVTHPNDRNNQGEGKSEILLFGFGWGAEDVNTSAEKTIPFQKERIK